MVAGSPVVIDLSHHNNVTNWANLATSGIKAVVHKATEGTSYRDSTYHERKAKAKAKGLLWGSYHFSGGGDVIKQVENYLNYAQPAAGELICLDYEPSYNGVNMTLEGMILFVTEVRKALGRYPLIYGGSLLREATKNSDSPILKACPLWFARYNAMPVGVPQLWDHWTLWQFNDGNAGPAPLQTSGVGHCDHDTYAGTTTELVAKWPLT
jgi:lysozyme